MPARRKYDRNAHRRRFKKGRLTYRGKGAEKGSGHRAGETWGMEKQIDPKSRVTKYSKNSPSFDEGVWTYKENMKGKDTNYWWQFGDDAAALLMQFSAEADPQRRRLLAEQVNLQFGPDALQAIADFWQAHPYHFANIVGLGSAGIAGAGVIAHGIGSAVARRLKRGRGKKQPTRYQGYAPNKPPPPSSKTINDIRRPDNNPYRPPGQYAEDASWWTAQFGYLNDVPRASEQSRQVSKRERAEQIARHHATAWLETGDEKHLGVLKSIAHMVNPASLFKFLTGGNRPGEELPDEPERWSPNDVPRQGSLRSYHTPQLSEDAWWAAQFDVARLKVGGHRRIGPVKKESHLRAETSRDVPYTDEEKSKARGEHILGKKQGDKKKKGKHKRQDKPRDEAGRFTAEASSRIKHDPETGRSEVEPWTPKGRATPFSDQDWWQGQEAIQFYGSGFINRIARPQTGQHKPDPHPDTRSDDSHDMEQDATLMGRYMKKGGGPKKASENVTDAQQAAEQRRLKRQRWSPKDLKPPPKPGARRRARQQPSELQQQLSEDAAWWAGQANLQFYGSDWLKDLPPPRGVHKPHPVPDKSAREQAFGPELSTAHRIAQILSIPIQAAISLLGGSSEKTRQKKVREQRWSPKDLGRAPQEPVHPPRPSPPQQYPPLPPKPRGGRVRRQSQQPQQPAYAPAEAYSEDQPMPESADAYQGRLVAQYPSMYQPIQFGEKPPNLVLAEYMGRSCASCKHFKEKKGKEVDDQGRCSLYDYVVKARMTCDAWTPTKEQQDFRGPGVMLDRKGGDPQHGGTSQLSEPIQFYGVQGVHSRDLPPLRGPQPARSNKTLLPGALVPDPHPAPEGAMADMGRTLDQKTTHVSRLISILESFFGKGNVDKTDATMLAAQRQKEAEEARKKRQGGGGGGGFRFQKPGAQVQPQSYSGGAATQQMPGRLRQRPQIAAMSEDDYFEGYEEHLLKTMPERYQ